MPPFFDSTYHAKLNKLFDPVKWIKSLSFLPSHFSCIWRHRVRTGCWSHGRSGRWSADVLTLPCSHFVDAHLLCWLAWNKFFNFFIFKFMQTNPHYFVLRDIWWSMRLLLWVGRGRGRGTECLFKDPITRLVLPWSPNSIERWWVASTLNSHWLLW